MNGVTVHIVDRFLGAVPPGVAGELLIGGPGVTCGYFGRSRLTAERFVPDPTDTAVHGARMYRSGDLVRWQRDERNEVVIEFLGRIDDQVKLRGYRIECGEIAAALMDLPGIRQAHVVLHRPETDEPFLIAWIVGTPPASIRAALANVLPDYMIPAHFSTVESLPLNTSGKIDLKRLPLPGPSTARTAVAPRNALESTLVTLWREVLGQPEIGIHDNFFELGGHSIHATRLKGLIERELKLPLAFKDLFEAGDRG